ncbi:hypothetical protein O7614_22730 [Micromonospora sp. WMMD961]|uniref:hypothetical protein n=1 Tax=Micromonospora sp. WMMD961 TaxID=3016100 RepID=UPI0024162026|nr:hypothetical protein [Micromonospora sp. WMMD961]MDG4782480.1 hypothetical protein [Micromonospora sp. WMMD961]
MRAEIGFSVHRLRFGVVCQPQAELAVDLGFVGGIRVAEHGDDVPEGVNQRGDLCLGHSAWCGGGPRVQLGFGSGPFSLCLGYPVADDRGVGAGVEGRSVALKFRVAVGDGRAGGGDGG